MAFKRDENFKMDMQKCLKFQKMEITPDAKDRLKNNTEEWLEIKEFRGRALVSQDARRTEAIYSNCNGKKVRATFERLRREVEDLHYQMTCGPRLHILTPVQEYSAGSCDRSGRQGEITFKTRKGRKSQTIKFVLKEQPPSAVFPKAPRDLLIKMEVNMKIPESLKLRQAFIYFLSSGDLLLDFITDKLWPTFEAAEGAIVAEKVKEYAERNRKSIPEIPPKKEVIILPTVNLSQNIQAAHRSFAGHERPPRGNSHFNSNNTFSHHPQREFPTFHNGSSSSDRGGRSDRGDRFSGRGGRDRDYHASHRDSHPRDRENQHNPRENQHNPRENHQNQRDNQQNQRENYQSQRENYPNPRENHQNPRENHQNPRDKHQNQREHPARNRESAQCELRGFGTSNIRMPAQDVRKERGGPLQPLMGMQPRGGGGGPRFGGSGRRGSSDSWRNKDRPPLQPQQQQQQPVTGGVGGGDQ